MQPSHGAVHRGAGGLCRGFGEFEFSLALTLDGNGVSFTGPGGNGSPGNFQINGNDSSAPSGTPSRVSAIGYTNSNDGTSVSRRSNTL